MLRQILGMAAMRRMGPMGKAMIAAQLGSMAYGMYKQRKARNMALDANRQNGVGLDNGFGAGGNLGGIATRKRSGFNPFG